MPIKQEDNKTTQRIKFSNTSNESTDIRRVYQGSELVYGLYDINYNVGTNSGASVSPTNDKYIWGVGKDILPTPNINVSNVVFDGWYKEQNLINKLTSISTNDKVDYNLFYKFIQSQSYPTTVGSPGSGSNGWSSWSTSSSTSNRPSDCPSWAVYQRQETRTEGSSSGGSGVNFASIQDSIPLSTFYNLELYDSWTTRNNGCTWWVRGRVRETSGNYDALTYIPNAYDWLARAQEEVNNPGTWPYWHGFEPHYAQNMNTPLSGIRKGDIIVGSNRGGGGPGHVAFVEDRQGDIVTYTEWWVGASNIKCEHISQDGSAGQSIGGGSNPIVGYISSPYRYTSGSTSTTTYYSNYYAGTNNLYYNYNTNTWTST